MSTVQLTSMMLLAGLIVSYICRTYGNTGKRCMQAGVLLGVIAALIMTFFKTNTNRIDTGIWNLRIYGVSIAAFVLFLIFTALGKRLKRLEAILPSVMMLIVVALLILYSVPDYLGYPHAILLTEKTVFSTAFLYRMIGAILGFILVLVAGVAVYKGAASLERGLVLLLVTIGLLINSIRQITASFSIMLAKRIIPSNHTLFVIAKYASNYSNAFIYLTLLIVCVIPIVLWIRSFRVNEPYSNPAEHRKIRAKWRNRRRWSTTVLACGVLIVLTMTVGSSIVNRKVELSPVEDAVVEDGNVLVPFDRVSDGHLHRFGYTTENGVTIRFIVIQKPNSSSYGIGLDACDICGETGYYEKNGQVVCNLCDVVMNINTIGFKGGCNPIVIDYSIHDGQIVVPVEGLMEYESEFK